MGFGVTLTHAYSYNSLREYMLFYGLDTLKVVTQWGLDWNDRTRAKVLANYNVIVRTKQGDPSSGSPFLHWERVLAELGPWLDIADFLTVELGNEPNTHLRTQDEWFGYRYHLEETLNRLQDYYINVDGRRIQRIKTIAPGFSLQLPHSYGYSILADSMNKCDAVAMHIYGETTFYEQRTLAERIRNEYFKTLPLVLSEVGLQQGTDRLTQYRRLHNEMRAVHTTYYHLCQDRKIDPQYDL